MRLNEQIETVTDPTVRAVLRRIAGHIGSLTARQNALSDKIELSETGQNRLPSDAPPQPFEMELFVPSARRGDRAYGQLSKSALIRVLVDSDGLQAVLKRNGGGANSTKEGRFWPAAQQRIEGMPPHGGVWVVSGQVHWTPANGWRIKSGTVSYSVPRSDDK